MLTPGAVCQRPTSWSGCGYGKGLRSTPSNTLKIAVFAPMAMARVATVTDVKRGARASRRTRCRIWFAMASEIRAKGGGFRK
jgi:hypothetical protein